MIKLKLMIVIGTRPEIIKLSSVIKKADKYFDLILVHTSQNYDYALNEVFFENFGIRKPDYCLNVSKDNPGQTIADIISKTYELIKTVKPDAFLVLGDTNSALAAYSAKRLKVPIFHMEAGNRCFDERLPEEINRKILDHISDINLPYTNNAKVNLFDEGLKEDRVFVTGSPMKEVLSTYEKEIEKSNVLNEYLLEKNKYFVLSMHREENVDNEIIFKKLINNINKLADKYNYPIIFSVHPRTKKRIESGNIKLNPLIIKISPLGFFDYVCLQKNAFCTLSDSGTLAEESSILKFNAVSLRNSCERPEALESGNFVLASSFDDLLSAIDITVNSEKLQMNDDYNIDNVSDKVIKIILSYTSIINERVWKK